MLKIRIVKEMLVVLVSVAVVFAIIYWTQEGVGALLRHTIGPQD